MIKFTMVFTFPQEDGDIYIRGIMERIKKLEEKELIEEINSVEAESSLEVTFFSDNSGVNEESLTSTFDGIPGLDIRIFTNKIDVEFDEPEEDNTEITERLITCTETIKECLKKNHK